MDGEGRFSETATGPVSQLDDAQPPDVLARLMDFADAGGPVVLILVGLSILLLAVALMKGGQFLRLGVWHRARARQLVECYRQGDRQAPAGARPSIASRIVDAAIAARRTYGEEPGRAEAYRLIDEAAEKLRRHMRIMELIAGLAPLLGLFGTVLGMIEAFQNLEGSGARADPAILSGGIWQALLTTAVGLAVAMPAVVLVNLFDRAIESLANDLEVMVGRIAIPAVPQRSQPVWEPDGKHGFKPRASLSAVD